MHDLSSQSQSQTDILDPDRARALQAAFGSEPSIISGDRLPPFFHQVYFWDPKPPGQLGRDGHPRTSGLIAGLGLPRRMWAAGKLTFHAPLLAGVPAERITTREAVTRKTGRSGPLAFVRLRHDIRQRQGLVLTEWQELVYRPDGPPQSTPEPALAPANAALTQDFRFDPTLLFRYSALTMNGHRIHYDRDYARDVEGYDGLVVHGPILAHLLMQMADLQLGGLRHFSYQATAPLMDHEAARLCWIDGQMWVAGPDGRMCMRAQAS